MIIMYLKKKFFGKSQNYAFDNVSYSELPISIEISIRLYREK